MTKSTRIRAAAVLVLASAYLGLPGDALGTESARRIGCPVAECLSTCPVNWDMFCTSMGCDTWLNNCSEGFGTCTGMWMMYCGSPE